jgi:hypothetical protein
MPAPENQVQAANLGSMAGYRNILGTAQQQGIAQRTLLMQQQQAAIDKQAAVRQIFSSNVDPTTGKPNFERISSELYKGGFPDEATNLNNQQAALAKVQAEQAEKQAATEVQKGVATKNQYEMALNVFQHHADQYQSILSSAPKEGEEGPPVPLTPAQGQARLDEANAHIRAWTPPAIQPYVEKFLATEYGTDGSAIKNALDAMQTPKEKLESEDTRAALGLKEEQTKGEAAKTANLPAETAIKQKIADADMIKAWAAMLMAKQGGAGGAFRKPPAVIVRQLETDPVYKVNDLKVSNAIHARTLVDQMTVKEGPHKGEINFNSPQTAEFGMTLANLVSGTTTHTLEEFRAMNQPSLQKSIMDSWNQLVGGVVNVAPQEQSKLMKETVDRQGIASQQLRDGKIDPLVEAIGEGLDEDQLAALKQNVHNYANASGAMDFIKRFGGEYKIPPIVPSGTTAAPVPTGTVLDHAAAIRWAKDNPNDPRSTIILKANGL